MDVGALWILMGLGQVYGALWGAVGLTPKLAAPSEPPEELQPAEERAGGDAPPGEPPAPAAEVCGVGTMGCIGSSGGLYRIWGWGG